MIPDFYTSVEQFYLKFVQHLWFKKRNRSSAFLKRKTSPDVQGKHQASSMRSPYVDAAHSILMLLHRLHGYVALTLWTLNDLCSLLREQGLNNIRLAFITTLRTLVHHGSIKFSIPVNCCDNDDDGHCRGQNEDNLWSIHNCSSSLMLMRNINIGPLNHADLFWLLVEQYPSFSAKTKIMKTADRRQHFAVCSANHLHFSRGLIH